MKKPIQLKLIAFYSFLLLINSSFDAQNFTWKKGTTLADLSGIYGIQGTASSSNRPGSRDYPLSWTDAAGNFWLFGGNGYDAAGNYGYLNDLWKYNTSTSEWTWVKGSSSVNQVGIYGTQGVFAATNFPGGRRAAVSFIDSNGDLWLFGGYGYDGAGSSGELNDLWTYKPSTNQWRWMKGSPACFQVGNYGTQGTPNTANTPGARYIATGWKDANGEFWLFGGLGYNSSSNSYLSDLWKYNPSNNQWTWVKGSSALNQPGTYGTQGTPAAANVPGARCSSAGWTDASGNLWLVAGYGNAASGPANLLNDLWKYNVSTNEWTWMKGYNNTTLQQGTYGSLGSYAAANVPGARYDAVTWLDGTGNLWLFGGYGYGAGTTLDYLNDLWRFDITTNQWKWVKGSNVVAQAGVYGLMNAGTPFTMPGSRGACGTWKDLSNNLWLFGGTGYNTVNNVGKLNDLWKFDNCIGPNISISSSTNSICSGDTAILTVSGASTYTWSTAQISPTLVISPNGSTSYTVFGTDANACKDTTSYTLNVFYLPTISISSNSTVVCPGLQAVLTASGASSYSWAGGSQTVASITINPMISTTYTVTGTDTNGCSDVAMITQSVALCLGIDGRSIGESIFELYPNPSTGLFTIHSGTAGKKDLVIFNAVGQRVFECTLNITDEVIKVDLAKGVYYYRVLDPQSKTNTGKLIID